MVTLGEQLIQKRQELGLTIHHVAQEIQAPADFIVSLEAGDYHVFSAKVYALGFLKKLLALYACRELEFFTTAFEEEWNFANQQKVISQQPCTHFARRRYHLSPASAGLVAGCLILFFFLLLFSGRLITFIRPPTISLYEPADRILVGSREMPVRGTTQKESRLLVNGHELKLDETGNFNEKIYLAQGLNRLEFYAENRFGKSNREVRYVVAR